jgi:hypothetical protein
MLSRTKLFVSKRLQKKRPEPRRNYMGSIPSEDGFCSLETKHDRRIARSIAVCFNEITGTRTMTLKNSPGFES